MFGLSGMGKPNPWGMMGQMGQQLMQRGRPQMMSMTGRPQGLAGTPLPQGQGMPYSMQQNPLAAMGGFGSMMPMFGGLLGMLPGIANLPPEIRDKFQSVLGPASEAGWGAGTTTTPAAFPQWLQGLFGRFNR